MILVQDVVNRTLSLLDAEGSDRYLFDQDFKHAINSAVEWLVAVFNSAFADNKLSEEDLRDLTRVKVFQANDFSRVKFDSDEVGEKLWTILAILTEITVYPPQAPPVLADPTKSVYHNYLTFVTSDEAAKRLSAEEWYENKKNIFKSGNNVVSNGFKKYAYLNFFDYSSTQYLETGELEIRPDVSSKFVAISYLKYPDPITAITDEVEFPSTLTDILVQKTANYISIKQGDGTSLYSVTETDVSRLISIMT